MICRWGKILPLRVFTLIGTPARWLLVSQMYCTDTCVHVVWLCFAGCVSTLVLIDCQGLPLKWMIGAKPVGKIYRGQIQSTLRKYHLSWTSVQLLAREGHREGRKMERKYQDEKLLNLRRYHVAHWSINFICFCFCKGFENVITSPRPCSQLWLYL